MVRLVISLCISALFDVYLLLQVGVLFVVFFLFLIYFSNFFASYFLTVIILIPGTLTFTSHLLSYVHLAIVFGFSGVSHVVSLGVMMSLGRKDREDKTRTTQEQLRVRSVLLATNVLLYY